MKTTILILSVLLLSILEVEAQNKKYLQENNIEEINFSPKLQKEVINYRLVKMFGVTFYITPNLTGKSELPFEMAKYDSIVKSHNFEGGEQEIKFKSKLVAKSLKNLAGNKIDEYSPTGLTARKKVNRSSKKSHIETEGYYYKRPYAMVIEGEGYFFFRNGREIIITPINGSLQDEIDYGNRQVTFVNEDNFYIFWEIQIKNKKRDKLD